MNRREVGALHQFVMLVLALVIVYGSIAIPVWFLLPVGLLLVAWSGFKIWTYMHRID